MEQPLNQAEVDEIVVGSFLRALGAAALTTGSDSSDVSPPPDDPRAMNPIVLSYVPSADVALIRPVDHQQSRRVASNQSIDLSAMGFFEEMSIPSGLSMAPLEQKIREFQMPNDIGIPLEIADSLLPVLVAPFNHDPAAYIDAMTTAESRSLRRIPSSDDGNKLALASTSISKAKTPNRAHRGRLIVEREITTACKQCHTVLGGVRMSGSAEQFTRAFVCDLICTECSDDENRPTVLPPRAKAKTSSGGNRAERPECRVCKVFIGTGGLRTITVNEPTTASSVWVTPDLVVDYMCESCFRQFKFCLSCSSGSSTKAPKYRPKEMFLDGNAACFLPHARAASFPEMIFISYQLPSHTDINQRPDLKPWRYIGGHIDQIPYSEGTGIATALMEQDVITHLHHFMYHYFDGATMQDYTSRCTWDLLQNAISLIEIEFSKFIRGQAPLRPRPPGTNIRRYIGIAFYPQPEAKRKRLVGGRASPSGLDESSFKYRSVNAGRWQIAGTSLATWDVDARVYINDRMTFFGSSNPVLNKVFSSLIEVGRVRVARDARLEGLPLPLHHSTSLDRMHRRAHMAKLLLTMHQIGFSTLEGYCEANRFDLEHMRSVCDSGDLYSIKEAFETFVHFWMEVKDIGE